VYRIPLGIFNCVKKLPAGLLRRSAHIVKEFDDNFILALSDFQIFKLKAGHQKMKKLPIQTYYLCASNQKT